MKKSVVLLTLLVLAIGGFAQKSSVIDYLALKDALVQSDVEKVKGAATALKTSLTAEEMDADLIVEADKIIASSDIKVQRASFKVVTDALIKSVKEKGADQILYVQFCPMAFNNTGASWLSVSQEIRNPYFGDMMLKCGRVTEEINQ